jgi:UTP--glucose-1-phosphate uridylyltransferase
LRASDKSHSSKSEFTQTEAINHMASKGHVSAVQFEGTRYDLGDPLGFLTSTMQIGLQRSEFKETLLDEMRRLLKLYDNPNDDNSA